MARTPLPRQLPVDVDYTPSETDVLALNTLTDGARQVIQTYGLKTANPDILICEIRGWQQSAVDALFQVGARLQLLHAVVPHGEWIERLDALGMDRRTASRIVQATTKYVGDGKARGDKLLSLGKSKLLELMVLDDEDIDVLDAGGQVGELDLDEVSRMGVSELRKAVREERQRIEAKDALLTKKDDKINALDEALTHAKRFKPNKNSEAKTREEQSQLDEIAAAVRAAELAFARLAVVTTEVMENATSQAIQGRAAEGLRYIQARMTELAEEHGLAGLAGDGQPVWMKG